MKIDIVGRNYTVSERLKGLIEKKVGKFEKFFTKTATAKVVCTASGNRYKMELNLTSGSMFVRGEVESDNMYQNLDMCIAKVEKQIIKHSDKLLNKRNVTKTDFEDFEFFEEEQKFASDLITKRKAYKLTPMTEEEAVIQMDLVGNDFFIFMNSEVNSVCVLYRKADGTIGLIETK